MKTNKTDMHNPGDDLPDEDWSDAFDEDNDFQECSECDGHPACEDFGCAIKLGLEHLLPPKDITP